MLPKERSPTTSWPSATNNLKNNSSGGPAKAALSNKNTTRGISQASASPPLSLNTPVQFVKGVGPSLGKLFSSRGIKTVWDLISFFPKTYQDRSEFSLVSELEEGVVATINCRVKRLNRIPILRGRKFILEAVCEDEAGGSISLKWFHYYKAMESRFKSGVHLTVTGKPKFYRGRFEITHPEISQGQSAELGERQNNEDAHAGRIVPFYVEIEGISSRVLRRVIWNALEKYSIFISEDLPFSLLEKYSLPQMKETIYSLHFPPQNKTITLQALQEKSTLYQKRYIFDEFFKFEFLILQKRLKAQKDRAREFHKEFLERDLSDLKSSLPFTLTQDQIKVLEDIKNDFFSSHPMNRLLQGDVGSGKTVVSLLAAAALIAQGSQCVLMAPTEILAEQHLKNALLFFGTKLKLFFLTGSTTDRERNKMLSEIISGVPCLVVGTHALFEDPVQFKNLDLIMIDEQHRFGVDQRRRLIEKGIREGLKPHVLVMTATPIPRTLALTVYGDLSVSLIQQKPPGRTPVITALVKTQTQKNHVFQNIKKELQAGRQAYFIFPLVDESEAEGFEHLKSVIVEAERLQREEFSEFKLGILHGKLSSNEKNEIMACFKRGEIHILVSTTVVEVGVDVPNSTVMVIEHAERFGLSQLHQLRGRVGRGSAQSYCYLLTHPRISEISELRLSIMEKSEDGFFIAEEDLKIRGPGEFLGTKQSGALPFVMADLVRDAKLLYEAREEALKILREDPELLSSHNLNLRAFMNAQGSLQTKRIGAS